MVDTAQMRITTWLEPRLPPRRVIRWAPPGVVAVFALLGAVQSDNRNPAVAVGALIVTIGATLLIASGRPRLLPVLALLSSAGVVVLDNGVASNVGWFAICVLVGWSAFIGGTRVAVAWWAGAVVMFGLEWLLTTDDGGWAAWVVGTTFAAFGCLLASRQRDLAHRLQLAQAGLADRARAEERNRIARELHDVIAHSLTVSLLHVSSARLAMEEDPAEAVAALAEAERLGRECLTEVRQVVGLLRHEGTSPLPGAAHLPALVEQFRHAGVDVALDVHGNATELTSTVGLAIYRILQEALTNAARHAPGSPTRADLSVTPAGAVLVVDSGGPAGSGTGSGLLSMRERAEVLGGECSAGATSGGWRVRAEIPGQSATRPVAYL
jgi:signal transduction histidine kinase